MENPLRILVVEDLPTDMEIMQREIRKAEINCIFKCVDTKEDFINAMNEFKPEFILSDYALPQFDGMQALAIAKKYDPTIPFIIVTGSMNEETAVACIKAGAEDYVIKEHIRQLAPAIHTAMINKQNLLAKLEAEKSLRLSEKHLRTIVDKNSDGIIITDQSGIILFANRKAEYMINLKAEDIMWTHFQKFSKSEKTNELDIFREKGELGKAELTVIDIEWDNEPAYLIMLHDITSRKQTEEKIKKINKIYIFQSDVNKAIANFREVEKLFDEVCRIAVETDLYKMVWIGLFDEVSDSILPAAWNGDVEDFFESLHITLHGNDELLETAGRSLRESHYQVSNDIQSDESIKILHALSLKKNFNSVLSIPLLKENRVFGVISFYSDKKNFFFEQEIKMLEDLSMDLSTAVHTIEHEKLQKHS